MNNSTTRIKPKSSARINAKGAAIRKKTKQKIRSKEVYKVTMKEIELLMKKGEKQLSLADRNRLRALAEAAETFEDVHEPLPIPSSLTDIIRMKMYQLRLSQNFAARLLGVSDTKFSLIMSGKQKPDIYFLKAIHDKLKVDANLILKAV